MEKNLGSVDKSVRVILAIVLVALYLGKIVTGNLANLFLVIAGILLITSLINFCPIYKIFGWKTSK